MLRLYVDRDPQTSKPQILYTRRWRRVVAEESELLAAESAKPEVYLAPVCTTGFDNDLIPWLLGDLPSMAGAKDAAGNPGITAQVILSFAYFFSTLARSRRLARFNSFLMKCAFFHSHLFYLIEWAAIYLRGAFSARLPVQFPLFSLFYERGLVCTAHFCA